MYLQQQVGILEVRERHLANFLQLLADSSDRPKSLLQCAVASVGHLFAGLKCKSPVTDRIHGFVTALVKGGTALPLTPSQVFSVSAFRQLFRAWEGGDFDLEKCRMQCLTLMAITLMLRPSDVAPRSIIVKQGEPSPHIFRLRQVVENPDGSLTLSLFGTKNDYHRDGHTVLLPPAQNDTLMCPVRAFLRYQSALDQVLP